MKQLVSILFIVAIAATGFSQLPNKAKKLVGKWQYKSGAGYEVWELNNNQLKGAAYRVSKNGDTTQVESLVMKRVNKTLVYILETNSQQGDSIVVQKNSFIGVGSKMKFNNLESTVPSMISYAFGCLNRKKLRIKIQYGVNEDPIILELRRYKKSNT
jgi:hypothetical protein